MTVFASKCPCCGRDIGFNEKMTQYTCVFCGTKLLTAALIKEEVEFKGEELGASSTQWNFERESTNNYNSSCKNNKGRLHSGTSQHIAQMSELTEEELRNQLTRKAGFKKELRQAVKELDELRQKRIRYESQRRLARRFISCGLVLIAAAALVAVVTGEGDARLYMFVLAAMLFVLGNALILIGEGKKRSAAALQKQLENRIAAKKAERDILIGRLNKLDAMLHNRDY